MVMKEKEEDTEERGRDGLGMGGHDRRRRKGPDEFIKMPLSPPILFQAV